MDGLGGTGGGAEINAITFLGACKPDGAEIILSPLREQFEPRLVSPYGLHLDAVTCAKSWDHTPWLDDELSRQIAVAMEWLRQCEPTRRPNRNIGTSYHLKHLCEDWWRVRRGGSYGYSMNGCFIMAALKLRLEIEVPASFVWGGREFFNPYISISTRSVRALQDEVSRAHLFQKG